MVSGYRRDSVIVVTVSDQKKRERRIGAQCRRRFRKRKQQARVVLWTGLFLLTVGVHVASAQEADRLLPERVLLVDEHRALDWEAVSLSLLVREVQTAAAEEDLSDFSVDVAGNRISIVYRDLQFPPESAEITPETLDKIQRLSRVLQRFSDRRFLVEGHTAKVEGDPDDGTVLSGQRARAVADAMADTDLFARRMISAIGRGEYEPIGENETPEGRAINRRVEISVFDEVDESTRTPQSVWWKQYTDWKSSGAAVFVVDDAVTDVTAVETALAAEQDRSGAPVAGLPIFRTREGIAIIYDDAEFDDQDAPTPDTRTAATGVANALTALDPDTQVRIGGFGDGLPNQRAFERHYQLGLLIAAASDIQPSATLVGDRPQAFLFDIREYFDPEDETFSPTWSVTSQPGDGDADLAGAKTYTPAFSATVPGEHELTLNVTNDLGVLRESSTVTVIVASAPAPSQTGDPAGPAEFMHSIELSGNGSFPVGRYREFSGLALGGGARFDILIPAFQSRTDLAPIRFGLEVESLGHVSDDTSSVERLWEFDWMLTAGYEFAVSEQFLVTPHLGYGGTVHVLTHTEEEDPVTFTEVNGESFYSQTMGLQLDLAWLPASWTAGTDSRIGVFLRPGYRVFFEEDYLGHSMTARIGARFYF
jgi:outer membrane protein OmpA-like peptidoglycan-associated protein